MGRWIAYYNQEGLHAGIMYLPPEEVFNVSPARGRGGRKA
jgi:hypothetical protein